MYAAYYKGSLNKSSTKAKRKGSYVDRHRGKNPTMLPHNKKDQVGV
jgi:hypothetical protein